MKLITISGIDGSGKSTQVKKLKEHLEKQGKSVKYFHITQFSIANKLLRKNRKPGQSKAVISACTLKIWLRKIALIIDVFRFRKFYLVLSQKNNTDYLITDRFFFDQIVNISYLEKGMAKKIKESRIVIKYIVDPDLKIYLKTSPSEITKRQRGVEQGVKYLKNKKTLYDYFCEKWNFDIIDGNQEKDEIHQEILNRL